MKLGEIKLESLRLMNANDEQLNISSLNDYRTDERYKEYLDRMIGSINRANTRFMTLKILPRKVVEIAIAKGKVVNDYLEINLTELVSDYGSIEKIAYIADYIMPIINYTQVIEGVILIPYKAEFNYKGETSILPDNPNINDAYYISGETKYYTGAEWQVLNTNEKFQIVYNPIIPSITLETDNNEEIAIPEVLARMIPYFVKGELYEADEPAIAATARNIFESSMTEYMSYGMDRRTHQNYVKNVMF